MGYVKHHAECRFEAERGEVVAIHCHPACEVARQGERELLKKEREMVATVHDVDDDAMMQDQMYCFIKDTWAKFLRQRFPGMCEDEVNVIVQATHINFTGGRADIYAPEVGVEWEEFLQFYNNTLMQVMNELDKEEDGE